MSGDPHVILSSERLYLTQARAHLARMRERTLSLEVQGGDRVSGEFLAATLWHRAQSLIDNPAAALFFGRTDHDDGTHRYIGRRHVADGHGDPVVIDWRAEVSRAFYRASRAERHGVTRRRRFGLEAGQITAFEDEFLLEPAGASASPPRQSAILAREIARPRVGPMRDIVATIQPEQDTLVRTDLATSICIQGAPGTGKTSGGLHRAAWLLYEHRARLSRTGVLVVGPSRSFLDHVAAVLPSLGEMEVGHATAPELLAAATASSITAVDTTAGASLKGDIRMASVLARAVWSHLRPPELALVLPRGINHWRVGVGEARSIVEELRTRGVRYGAARARVAQRLAHGLLIGMEAAGDSPDDRVQDSVARSREVRAYVESVWPALTPQKILCRLYCDPVWRAECAEGLLDETELPLLSWAPGRPVPRSPGTARWTVADVTLLDELADLLQRVPSLGHVVIDEAQDLSPMQLRAIGRRASTGSVTVLGDIAQGTTPWATDSWVVALDHLGQSQAIIEELHQGFRVPAAVIEWASRLLPAIAPGLRPPTSIRDEPGSLRLIATSGEGVMGEAVRQLRLALEREGSVGLIVADGGAELLAHTALIGGGIDHEWLGRDLPPDSPQRVTLLPATLAKGLEYDWVVVLDPSAIAAAEPDERTGLRRLYVVLTRAVSGLVVVHQGALPPLLAQDSQTPS